MEKKQGNFLVILVMILLFGMISFVTNLASPMGDILKNQFSVANWMGTLGVLANFIAYAVMGIPAGNMLQKYGYKKTALAAVTVGFVGVGIQTISGTIDSNTAFGVYLLGAFIAGFSMCMLNIVVNPMLNKLGGGGNKGNQLIQLGGTLNSVGATIVPIFVGALMGNAATAQLADARPALWIAMGIFALVFCVLFFVRIPEPHIEKNAVAKEQDAHSPYSFRHFVLGAIAIFIYVGVEVGIPNIGNLLMTKDLAMDAATAGTIVGTYWFLMMIGRLIGAAVGAKVSSKAMLSTVSILGILFVLLGIFMPLTTAVKMPVFQSDLSFALVSVPASIMFFTLCGLCTSVMWGGIFNLAVEGLGKYTPAASGIFMVMVCGGGVLPLVQGALADATSYVSSYWVIVAGLAFLLFYALIGSKNVNKDIPVE